MPGNGGWNLTFGGTGTNGAVLTTNPPGSEPIDRTRNALIALGALYRPAPMTCGTRSTLYDLAVADTYEDHPDWVDVVINWDKFLGDEAHTWTVKVVVSLKCENASTTVTPRVVLAGTSTLVGTAGSAHNTTSWAAQDITIPNSTGVVTYRLQIKTSDLLFGAYCIAELRMYAP